MTAALRRERGLIGDPNCISTGKNKMGIVFHYQGSDDSILICSLGNIHVFAFYIFNKLESTKCLPKVRVWTTVHHLGSPDLVQLFVYSLAMLIATTNIC